MEPGAGVSDGARFSPRLRSLLIQINPYYYSCLYKKSFVQHVLDTLRDCENELDVLPRQYRASMLDKFGTDERTCASDDDSAVSNDDAASSKPVSLSDVELQEKQHRSLVEMLYDKLHLGAPTCKQAHLEIAPWSSCSFAHFSQLPAAYVRKLKALATRSHRHTTGKGHQLVTGYQSAPDTTGPQRREDVVKSIGHQSYTAYSESQLAPVRRLAWSADRERRLGTRTSPQPTRSGARSSPPATRMAARASQSPTRMGMRLSPTPTRMGARCSPPPARSGLRSSPSSAHLQPPTAFGPPSLQEITYKFEHDLHHTEYMNAYREAYTDKFLLVAQVSSAHTPSCSMKEGPRMQKVQVDCRDVRDGASIQPVRLAQFRFNTANPNLRIQVSQARGMDGQQRQQQQQQQQPKQQRRARTHPTGREKDSPRQKPLNPPVGLRMTGGGAIVSRSRPSIPSNAHGVICDTAIETPTHTIHVPSKPTATQPAKKQAAADATVAVLKNRIDTAIKGQAVTTKQPARKFFYTRGVHSLPPR